MNITKRLSLLCFVLGLTIAANGQNIAVKTNLFYDAGLNVNAGVEVGLAPRWSVDLSGDYNRWTIREHKWKHWLVQPELRYWFCDRFVKHFVGVHALGGQFNIGNLPVPEGMKFFGLDISRLSQYRYQGWGVGAGIAYGYALPLGYHWNLEFEVGAGYVFLDYDRYACTDCGRKVDSDDHHYVGPTKAAINLVYVF